MNLYLYFSGTGNTKYVVKKFSEKLEEDKSYKMLSIEDSSRDYDKLIKEAEIITIAYPIYASILPYIMADFLKDHLSSFEGKKIITITTQLLFSGDGGALPYRLLKKCNVDHLHSIHVNMPSNLVDMAIFPAKPIYKTKKKVLKADAKINKVVSRIKSGKTIKDGRKWYSRTIGYLFQRGFGKGAMDKLRTKVRIDNDICIKCNQCVSTCPTGNLSNEDGMIKFENQCTLCYRCVNQCPTQAISIFSKKKPKVQYIREDYN